MFELSNSADETFYTFSSYTLCLVSQIYIPV